MAGAVGGQNMPLMEIFDLTPSHPLGHAVAQAAGWPVSPHEAREFAGGQHKLRPLVSVRGQDVFVFSVLHADEGLSVNDRLMRLLFFVATCRDHGAARVTAVIPWLPYARKDRVTKARDPVSSRYVAQLIEAAGTDCVISADVHNPAAFQNGFRCRTVHLDTCRLFATEVATHAANTNAQVTIVSPDCGGVKRAELLRQSVELLLNRPTGFAFLEKHRSGGVVTGNLFAGDVAGQDVWIADDIIESGETMLRAARACRDRGARVIHLLATHALGDPAAIACLSDPTITTVTVTDSAALLPQATPDQRFRVLSMAPTIGQCLIRMHHGQAVSPVLDPTGPVF